MEELGQKVSRFLELTRARTAVRCVHTLNAAIAAARRVNLPAWILDEAKKNRCGCVLGKRWTSFVWDLLKRAQRMSEEHTSGTDTATAHQLYELWRLLVQRKLHRPLTRREEIAALTSLAKGRIPRRIPKNHYIPATIGRET